MPPENAADTVPAHRLPPSRYGTPMTSYVIHALVQKRSELSGDIENTHNNLKRMIKELELLD